MITVKVTAYTSRGFFACDREWPIADEHRALPGMDIVMLFRRDHESTRIYSPFTPGFIKDYFYVRKAGASRFIANFVLDKRAVAKRETIPGMGY
jgi:hypothetical protein